MIRQGWAIWRPDPALPKFPGGGAGQVYLAPKLGRAFVAAEKVAGKAGGIFVTVERLLLGLALEKDSEAGRILRNGGVTPQNLNAAIEALRKGRTADTATAENAYDALKKYSRDLTQAARDGKLDPVIGRDEEIRRTIQVLSRRTKNNPVLIGEPGVGKTAIVEGLALRVQHACRTGTGVGGPFPDDFRFRAHRRGHHFDPARPEGIIRAAPWRAHHRFRAGGGGHAVAPLHHRPFPARQGDRSGGRGGRATEDAGRFQARRTRFIGPGNHPAQDRTGSAEEGKRPRLEKPPAGAGEGTRRSRGKVGSPDRTLERGESQAFERAEAEGRTRGPAH